MVLKDVAKELFPPDVPAIVKWRLMMSAVSMVMLFHVAWACGWMAYAGLGSGFAYAADVQSMQKTLNSLRTTALEQNMFDMHLKRCAADEGSEIRRFLTEKIESLQREYRELQSANYALPRCSDL